MLRRHPATRLLSSDRLLEGRVFDVLRERVRLPSGLEQDLVVLDHPGAVAVVPLFDDGSVLLVRQYRHAVGDWLLEVPAGRLERDEAPEVAALRELEEETGYRCSRLESLGCLYPAPGFSSERMFLFAGHGLQPVGSARAAMDEDEEFEVVSLPFERALEAVAQDAKSWIALARWQLTARGAAPRS